MRIPPADLSYISERFDELAADIEDAWRDNPAESSGISPPQARQAMIELMGVLHRLADENTTPATASNDAELNTLAEHGLHLLCVLADHATRVGLGSHARGVKDLCFPFAVWVVRHGGEFASFEPVVDAVAELANRLAVPDELAGLFNLIDEFLDSIANAHTWSPDTRNYRPWRVLVLNRAIVATRSLRPRLIEKAYEGVVELLPDEAPQFFEEALEQMDVVGYPNPVRAVVVAFYTAHCRKRILH